MIVLTGAAGFIGSNLLQYLNELGEDKIVVVDDFRGKKTQNLLNKQYVKKVHRDQLFDWLAMNVGKIKAVYHLGARTDTMNLTHSIFQYLNLAYSKRIWQVCAAYEIPLVYASSAATYGLGSFGFLDSHSICSQLQPLNPYAIAKNEFDKWALRQSKQPPFWVGLKFFNVYGPNESHKGKMASVAFHAFHQISETGKMRLFRSHRPDIADGLQSRDFIHVKDLVNCCHFFMETQPASGLYNVGTGRARTFLDLASAIFKALNLPKQIEFIDTPQNIRANYQYFTEADMRKTRQAGYRHQMLSLEAGIQYYTKSVFGGSHLGCKSV